MHVQGGNATTAWRGSGSMSPIMVPFGAAQRVCAVGAYVSSHFYYSHSTQGLCYMLQVAHTGPLDYQGHGLRGHPTLVSHQVDQ
jgi:hypothetical protein